MDSVLAADFIEFGRSGRTYSRAEVLGSAAQDIDYRLPLAGFQARRIDTSTVLVTYVSENAGPGQPELDLVAHPGWLAAALPPGHGDPPGPMRTCH